MTASSVYLVVACAALVVIAFATGCTAPANPNAHIVTSRRMHLKNARFPR
jgi:hypothetical protein